MNEVIAQDSGASLLELLAVVLIVAISATITMPLLQQQIAAREIDAIARRFIAHAHFARQQALHLSESVKLEPRLEGNWNEGWIIQAGCTERLGQSHCMPKIWLAHSKFDPVFIKDGARHFIDQHTKRVGIVFNAAGAAKTAHGAL
ncbi:GspH/FimT family pseudopilin [Polynucleobacter necessarius]|uniref:GspH/FimT family pseudopilin n=1 Tax=Polynucleobacter necessarius TaxID=576610 RepID=UPI001E60B0E5|nr:GspH/FimT family pseudopilin [Polynucleobacter necessarius]